MDKDPNLRKKRERAEKSYEPTQDASPFQSRRPTTKADIFGENVGDPNAHEDHQQFKFLRKFEFQHLRNDSMPVHYKNIDRHGLKNLEAEKTKPLDRIKIPAPLIFFTVLGFILYIGKDIGLFHRRNHTER